MTMQPERPERAPADERAEVEPSDVGSDPMHPHPQDRPDETDHHGQDDSHDDDPDDDNPDDSDDSGTSDDESPVDRYRDSPGEPQRCLQGPRSGR